MIKQLLLACSIMFSFTNIYAQTVKEMSKDSVVKNDTLQKVEVEASVGRDEWIKHLEGFLQPVIERAARKGLKKGKYVVRVRFLVEKNGTIRYVEALNDPGYGLGKGSEEAVKKGPDWSPGMVNGKPVRSYHTQPITYVID